MVVNATNFDILCEAFGNNTAKWVGHTVILEGVKVPFKGKMVDSIRVSVPKEAKLVKTQDIPFNDEIPDYAA